MTLRFHRLTTAVAGAVALVALPAAVAAHADLESSTPEAGADLATAPTKVVLTFSGELDPASGFVVTGAGGVAWEGELDLDVADRNVLSGSIEVTEPGAYTVAWTAVSADGHAEEGNFQFTFRSDASAAADNEPRVETTGSPDTALPAPTNERAPTLLGLLLIVAATSVALRRSVAERAA